MMGEVWAPIPGFEGWYEASSEGRIRSLDRVIPIHRDGRRPYQIFCRGKILKPSVVKGYHFVKLWIQHKGRNDKVGTFVMEAFVGPRPKGRYVCHRDGTRSNNRKSNLYYGTPKQNSADAIQHGTTRRGEGISWSRLTDADVRYIRQNPDRLRQREFAAQFGISQSQVSRVKHGRQWRHVQ